MNKRQDVGLKAVEFVRRKMNVDSAWSIDEPRGFAWWGDRLKQRVWAEPVRVDGGVRLSDVHAEVVVLRGVPVDDENLEAVLSLNESASLFAYILNPKDGTLRMHSKILVHSQNLSWTSTLLLSAAGLQASTAYLLDELLAEQFGGEVAESSHPENGNPEEPDEMLGIVSLFQQIGAGPSPFDSNELEMIGQLADENQVLCNWDEEALVADFPFGGPNPLFPGMPMTAQLKISPRAMCGFLGSGCSLHLRFPQWEDVAGTANDLNQLESQDDTANHLLGAWSRSGPVLSFITFLPALVHQPGLLANLYLGSLLRVQLARDILPPIEETEPPGPVKLPEDGSDSPSPRTSGYGPAIDTTREGEAFGFGIGGPDLGD